VLATLLTQKPADSLDALEAVSAQVKGTYFKPGVPAPPPGTMADAPGSDSWQAGSTALLKVRCRHRAPDRARLLPGRKDFLRRGDPPGRPKQEESIRGAHPEA